MNKKKLAATLLALCNLTAAFAGGILTNTNTSARFARLMALDASTKVDAAYYNPAGLVKLNDGVHFSFTNQSAFQTRKITSTFAPFAWNGGNTTKVFEGTASAPIIPSLQAAYKKGNWVLSANFCVIGGGGKATFNEGLPMFEAASSTVPGILYKVQQAVPGSVVRSTKYSVDQYMTGSSFIYGAQMGGSYKINEMLSVYGGLRLNIVNNHYEGYLKNLKTDLYTENMQAVLGKNFDGNQMIPVGALIDMVKATPTLSEKQIETLTLLSLASKDGAMLDSKQSGWGVTPILGFNFSYNKLNVGMKYEFKSALNVENKTLDGKDAGQTSFKNGVNTPHDIPALFTVGASYEVLPKLTASVGFHHFFDKQAKIADDKQKKLNAGTSEYLAGVEYKINDMFLISCGGQITRYGVTDDYQSDLSFSLNSHSIGFGGAVNVAKNVQINAGYFWTSYSDWTKETEAYNGIVNSVTGAGVPGKDIYSRTNKVVAVGVDFSF